MGKLHLYNMPSGHVVRKSVQAVNSNECSGEIITSIALVGSCARVFCGLLVCFLNVNICATVSLMSKRTISYISSQYHKTMYSKT